MRLSGRDIRKLIHTKVSTFEFKGTPSTSSMLEGQVAIQKKSNSQLALYRKKFGKLWKSYMSSDGNQFVDKNLNVNGVTKSKVTAHDLIFEKGKELVISSGVINISHSYHQIDTESDASSDNLQTINGGFEGQILVLTTSNSNRDVVLLHDNGNILISDGANHTLSTNKNIIVLFKIGNNWYEIITKSHQ